MPNIIDLTEGGTKKIDVGEAADIDGTLDMFDEPFQKLSLLTFTVTHENELTGEIINGRDNQDILDANGGTVNDDGTFKLKLSSADNVLVNTDGSRETHLTKIAWSWVDQSATPRNGDQWYRTLVVPKKVPVSAVGWLG